MKLFDMTLPSVQGHCDVPCGIYDPATAQIAAHSVARFLDQIAELPEGSLDRAAQARLARLVSQKEAHAAEVKAAVVVIWGDYFKAPQFEAHPSLHELTHSILLTASACKQEIDPANGRKLVDLVNDFAEIFWQTKDVDTERVVAKYAPNLEIVRPR
ncbi:MAG: superoxide dismutase, Ni [Pseudomonadota bacterium]